jgi:hypothetical protein
VHLLTEAWFDKRFKNYKVQARAIYINLTPWTLDILYTQVTVFFVKLNILPNQAGAAY